MVVSTSVSGIKGRHSASGSRPTGNPTEHYGIDTISQLAATVWQNMG